MALIDEILGSKHPVFVAYGGDTGQWSKNETRLRGGTEVFEEVHVWDFETKGAGHHLQRKERAVYTNFCARMTEKFVGHLSREAPAPGESMNFGPLGEISTVPVAAQTRADLLYRSVDGTGNDGTDWVSFFDGVQKRSMSTGHRWLVVETPMQEEGAQLTEADELAGVRPYVIEYSPTQVPDWYYMDGRLQYLLVQFDVREPRLENGKFVSTTATRKTLYVREGWQGFGGGYQGGGWWVFDSENKEVATGNWEATAGEIPAVPFFYEKDDAHFSRPALTQIGQIAVAYMNLDSAGDNDAIEGGMRRVWALGLRAEEHEQVKEQVDEGSRFVAVPSSHVDGRNPQIIDSAQASANEAIETRMKKREEQAAFLSMDEMKSGANTSGIARQIEWYDVKSPRLALMARNRMVGENACLRYLIMRWGFPDTGEAHISWKLDYDIKPLSDDVREIFELMSERMINSPMLESLLVEAVLKEKGFTSGEIGQNLSTIRAELIANKQAAVAAEPDSRPGSAANPENVPTQAGPGRPLSAEA